MRNLYVPSALVFHAGSATTGSRHNEFKVRQAAGNSLYMLWKNMPAWQLLLNGPMIMAGILIKAAYFARLGLGKAYLSGLGRGFSLIRGIRAGSGCPAGMQLKERMKDAAILMEEDGAQDPRLQALWKIQLQLFRGLPLLLENRR